MTSIFRVGICNLVCLAALAMAQQAQAAAPTPTDPEGMAGGGLPGTFPTSVTAANVLVEQGLPAVMAGAGSDNLRVSFPASGPIKWTESRHNEGDVSLLIGPFDPNDSSYFPPNSFSNFAAAPGSNPTLGWRVSRATGAALATVRHNGVDYGSTYTYLGSPVGTIHGIAYFNLTGAQGWGFQMDSGEYHNGGGASTDLQMGIAGFDDSQGESSSSFAAAYFPYEQGWTGAWVNPGSDGEATFANASPGLPTSAVNYTSNVAFVKLPGVDSGTDGMLFVAPTDDNNNTNIAAAFPNNGGWTVSVREDDNIVFDGSESSLVPGDQNDFQFLYVPYSAQGLIGGHVNGSNATTIHSAGDNLFDITRTAAGKYSVSVYESDGQTKRDENDGMLILSVAGAAPNAPTLADRKFMSYQYDAGSGNFLIESRELIATNSPNTENLFGDELALRDVNFYFAWVDFLNPLAPPPTGIPGDYNANGTVDAADYVAWRNAGATDTLPNDSTPGSVGPEDYTVWRANFGKSLPGSGAGLAVQGVPEPSSIALWSLLLVGAATGHRARRS